MNVATIDMPKSEARRRLKEVRRALHRKVDQEYQTLEKAYSALAVGCPVINVYQAIADCPRDHVARPKLAIARADQPYVHLHMYRGTNLLDFTTPSRARNYESRVKTGLTIEVPRTFAWPWPFGGTVERSTVDGYALVPLVPPEVKRHHALDKAFILWEVDRWADERRAVVPDRDPYLLHDLGNGMYSVLGEWDLTELERMVMRGRLV